MPGTDKHWDVAVIGAGIIGMSVAWHLRRRGADVLVVEATGVGSGATAVQPGGVRTQWTSPQTCAMALESRDFYDKLADHLHPVVSPEFDACGYAFAASSKATLDRLAEAVRRQNDLGVRSSMVSPAELAALVPGLDTSQVAGGSYHAEDGYFGRPAAVVAAFADALRRDGGTIRYAAVERLEQTGNGWVLPCSDGSRATACHVVVAAGTGSAELVGGTGYELAVKPEPRYLFYSNPIMQPLVRPLVVFQDEHFAVKQLADGCVLASDLRHGLTGERDEPRWRDEVTEKARRLIAVLEYVRYPVMVEGQYDVTPDLQLVVGPVPGRDGLLVAAGMNGRGLMLAPSVGRMVADTIDNPGPAAIPAPLLPGRFEGGQDLEGEHQVI
jgi:sarcosine oxidase subunit beta